MNAINIRKFGRVGFDITDMGFGAAKTLQEAAKQTFPADGVTPPVSEGPMWAPNLYKP